jgi:hypothetical protein
MNRGRAFFATLLTASLLSAQSLTKPEQAAVRAIDAETPAAVSLLERLVNINSGTFNPAGVTAVGKAWSRSSRRSDSPRAGCRWTP